MHESATRPDPVTRPAPLEERPWFAALSEDQRALFQQEELIDEVHWERLFRGARKAWRRPVLDGLLVFLGTNFLVYGFRLPEMLLCAIAGVLAGGIWWITSARQLLSPLIGMFVELLLLIYLGGGYLGALVVAVPFLVGLFAAFLGARREEPDWVWKG